MQLLDVRRDAIVVRMKITALRRREFLGFLGAVLAHCALPPRLFAAGDEPEFDDNLLVLLADIHAGASGKCAHARCKFAETVEEILKMRPKPRNVIVFGDVAYLYGLGADYDFSRPLFQQLEDAGITVTIGMGNHDRRSEYAKRWPEAAAKSLVPGRYVHLVETPHVDFLMLDTLAGADDRPDDVEGPQGGRLGKDEQIFLCDFLAGRQKSVILCAHHPSGDLWVCGKPMREIVEKIPCVAGFIHGHYHCWRSESATELCLPSTGAWGDVGYSICRISSRRVTVEPVLKDFQVPVFGGGTMSLRSLPRIGGTARAHAFDLAAPISPKLL